MPEIKIEKDESFEYAIILSLLSRKPVEFLNPVCFEAETEVLEYFKLVSPEIKYTFSDNNLQFIPGFLTGGKIRGEVGRIPMALKHLIILSPFLSENVELELSGITNCDEFSTDIFKITFFKIFRFFGIPAMDINIKRRGFAPEGKGIVTFKGSSIRFIDCVDAQAEDSLSKIRGFVITSKIGSDFAHRMIDTVKGEMSDLANTKVLCIINNREDSGPSPGYECSVLGESNNGVFYESVNDQEIPEKMAKRCCKRLLKSILKGGIFDQKLLPIVIIYMGLAKGVSHLKIGKLDKISKKVLDLLGLFFSVTYKLYTSDQGNTLTVVGCRYNNVFKPL